nr:putative cyclase/dehydrase protein [Ipomoea batatas]
MTWSASASTGWVKMYIDVPTSIAYKCYADREAIPQWMPFISSIKILEDKPDLSRWSLKYKYKRKFPVEHGANGAANPVHRVRDSDKEEELPLLCRRRFVRAELEDAAALPELHHSRHL